jgi:hypothetical protein
MLRRHVFNTVLLVLVLVSCQSDRLEIDVSDVEVNFQSSRFDKDLFSADFDQLDDTYQGLYQSYGSFFADYLEVITRIGPADQPASLAMLEDFTTDEYMQKVFEDIASTHDAAMPEYDAQFTDAFKHLKYYFPQEVVPRTIYHHSGFNIGIFPTDSVLAIGLDFYLGPANEIVQSLDTEVFPSYMRDKMKPEYVVSDALRGMLMVRFQDQYDGANLLSQSMYYGKIMYCLDALQPTVEDSIKMRYTGLEMLWAQENKQNIWKEYANQHALEETRPFEIQKWIEDGPFTSAGSIPQDSPSRLGVWISWQVIREYMNANEEVTLPELMADKNYYKFMKYFDPS